MKRNHWYAALFLAPAAICLLVFSYLPLIQDVWLSFHTWNMVSPTMKFVGLQNYQQLCSGTELSKVLFNTLLYVFILIILNFILPYLLSFIMAHGMTSCNFFYRSALFIPSTLSLAVASIIFLWILNPLAGPLHIILSEIGLESPRWFKESGFAIAAIGMIIGWKVFGYNLIVMLAAMVAVPQDLLEAAKLENASKWQIFRHIILPLTSPTALYVFVITVVFGLQYVLVPVNMLTQGGPDQGSTNLVYIIYQYGFIFFQTGKAAAFAVLTIFFYSGFLLLKAVLDKKVHYEN
ncbi:sn-glycerol 3-phosphate transport system permease protein [Sporomusaceae bacterium BoRhaA]|uniref:carbohydrate ABC transporter permease n=1 Tax=Pelorhabdus rhamnosifermentans TaxID=2772457 RepID=UPI001C06056E|nr:sugar ABC transporter permease [Pelorhabdus rhamnosifermentans]MBU2699655.1 sn-glycerol 3-phosphate transport system permease protein [Pelorhabdus rhamnosifermentans]